jgi:acyl carrier protein
MNPSTLAEVRQIAADVFTLPLESVQPDSSPDSIPSWDSVQHLNLVMALEEKFAVQFEPEEFDGMTSIEAIAALLEQKQS